MPANNTGVHVGYLAGKYEGRMGHLYSPGATKGPHAFLPYALDNGCFMATTTEGRTWDRSEFIAHLDWAASKPQSPLWVVVPDVVGDRDATLREWDQWAPHIERYGWPLAMAVQDGMIPGDVPAGVVCFLGGTTTWKRQNIWKFCQSLARVHVGRINTEKWLWACHRAGAESCDGTGWYRGDKRQLAGLVRYLDRSSKGLSAVQAELEFSEACGGRILSESEATEGVREEMAIDDERSQSDA